MAEVDAVEEDAVAELAGVLLAPDRLSAACVGPDEGKFKAAIGNGVVAEGGMKLALFGAEGKVGVALKPVLERAGHDVRGIEIGDEPDVAGLDAAVDFTTPDAAPANVRAALEQGVSCIVGTTGWDPQPLHELAADERACASSSHRTSPSAPCS